LKWPGGTNLQTIVISSGERVEETKKKHTKERRKRALRRYMCKEEYNIKMDSK
jgi:hypothetical protein